MVENFSVQHLGGWTKGRGCRFYLVYFLVILYTFCAVEGSKKSEELEGKEAQVCEDITIPMCQVSCIQWT